MSDDHDGASLHEMRHAVDQIGFGLEVKRCGRLVEEQDRRVLQERTRQGHALLLLTEGEASAAVAHGMAVDADCPAGHVVETRNRGENRRLAGSRCADQGDRRTDGYVQRNASEHRITVVRQGDVVEIDPDRERRELDRGR